MMKTVGSHYYRYAFKKIGSFEMDQWFFVSERNLLKSSLTGRWGWEINLRILFDNSFREWCKAKNITLYHKINYRKYNCTKILCCWMFMKRELKGILQIGKHIIGQHWWKEAIKLFWKVTWSINLFEIFQEIFK